MWAYGLVTRMATFSPLRCARSTSESRLKSSTRPFTSALSRGCETPSRAAALACVSAWRRIRAAMAVARSRRSFRRSVSSQRVEGRASPWRSFHGRGEGAIIQVL